MTNVRISKRGKTHLKRINSKTMEEKVFVCRLTLRSIPFVVLTEEEAKEWVAEDPECRYYETIKIVTYVKS